MSGTSGSGVPSGVVQNSALSFVAHAQPTSPEVPSAPDGNIGSTGDQSNQTDRLMPAGLKSLYEACSKVYPNQPNPLQVTTRLKYWLGGQDPLDYISMYWNPGKPDENIPPHWHYVSFGLSDLHGDGRVHPEPEPGGCSGYGLELTFRLASEAREPPLWPAALLQQLARYIFITGNKFCAGDHVSWHAALDGSRSRVRHLLVADDPQLAAAGTPHGTVAFLQMVGCTSRELRAAQRSSGFEVLKALSEDLRCGGRWLVTRAQRRASARLRATARRAAHLAGVSARVRWHRQPTSSEVQPSPLSLSVERQIKETLQRGLTSMSDRGTEGHNMSTDSFEMSSIERALPQLPEIMQGSWRGEDEVEYLDGVHLMLNAEGASLLPLAIDGRVLHGRHFTWRQGRRAVTVLPPSVAGALVSAQRPYAARGDWLQILIPPELAHEMSKQLSDLSRLAESDSESEGEAESSPRPALPLVYTWPRHRLTLSVLHDMEILY